MWGFYQDTGSRKWGQPYLLANSSTWSGNAWATALLFLACRDGLPIAGALNFVGPTPFTAAIGERPTKFRSSISSFAITGRSNGRSSTDCSVQAGAQGEHKVARGYEPVITTSAHFIPN